MHGSWRPPKASTTTIAHFACKCYQPLERGQQHVCHFKIVLQEAFVLQAVLACPVLACSVTVPCCTSSHSVGCTQGRQHHHHAGCRLVRCSTTLLHITNMLRKSNEVLVHCVTAHQHAMRDAAPHLMHITNMLYKVNETRVQVTSWPPVLSRCLVPSI